MPRYAGHCFQGANAKTLGTEDRQIWTWQRLGTFPDLHDFEEGELQQTITNDLLYTGMLLSLQSFWSKRPDTLSFRFANLGKAFRLRSCRNQCSKDPGNLKQVPLSKAVFGSGKRRANHVFCSCLWWDQIHDGFSICPPSLRVPKNLPGFSCLGAFWSFCIHLNHWNSWKLKW